MIFANRKKIYNYIPVQSGLLILLFPIFLSVETVKKLSLETTLV